MSIWRTDDDSYKLMAAAASSPKRAVHTARPWMFTYQFNAVDAERDAALAAFHSTMEALVTDDIAKYVAYQLEEAPTTKQPHFQGYIVFQQPKRLAAVRKILSAHWEPRMGTHDQANDYVTKDESRLQGPWTYGVSEDEWVYGYREGTGWFDPSKGFAGPHPGAHAAEWHAYVEPGIPLWMGDDFVPYISQ